MVKWSWLLIILGLLLVAAGTDFALIRAYDKTVLLVSQLGLLLLLASLILSFSRWPIRHFARGYLLCAVMLHAVDSPQRPFLQTLPGFSSELAELILPRYLPTANAPQNLVYYRHPERPAALYYRQWGGGGSIIAQGVVSSRVAADVLLRARLEFDSLPWGPTFASFQAVFRECVIFWLSLLSGTILFWSNRSLTSQQAAPAIPSP